MRQADHDMSIHTASHDEWPPSPPPQVSIMQQEASRQEGDCSTAQQHSVEAATAAASRESEWALAGGQIAVGPEVKPQIRAATVPSFMGKVCVQLLD
jgi:hypothetical protein